ncbi:hypothetical protein B6D60_11225 [candidate division KSB1 bacterium 4484_87]|nr:MAG: hypothetical protein B6D60_11225 [candidate division KSB1 bacterium 4484_87]
MTMNFHVKFFKVVTVLIMIVFARQSFAEKKYDFSNWQSNFSAIGEKSYDYFGHAIATGDVNGDGAEDILVGAFYADPNDRSGGGCAYLFLGNSTSSQQRLLNLAQESADVKFLGPANNSQLGKSVAIGNVNNDAYDDIIIAAPYHSENGIQTRGAVYVILGSSTLTGVKDLAAGGYDSKILGAGPEDQFGLSLLASDLNHDNFDDIIIASPYADQSPKVNCGKIYVFWGSSQFPSSIDLANQTADLTIVGEATNDKAGFALCSGNVNGDNYFDLLIGAPSATIDAVQRSNAGIVYLIAGKANYASSTIELSASQEVISKFYGGLSFSSLGKTIATGDVNGDNYDDILLTDFAGNNNKGVVGIVLGNITLPAEIDFAYSAYNNTISGGEMGGILGEDLLVTDINNDTYADIFIGVPNANTDNGNSSGLVYLIKGKQFLPTDYNLNTENADELYLGSSAENRFGFSMSALKFNKDSKKDVCFGAPEGGYSAGQIFTVLGGLPYILNKNPEHKAHRVEVDTTVSFDLYDDDEGVDINSVHVVIGGVEYTSTSPNFSYSGTPSKYSVTIVPVERFGYDQIVDVTVNCDDLAGWHMPTESYYFRTREDTDAPYTARWVPAPDSTNIAVDANVTFHIYDDGEGVNLNSVVVNINGTIYTADSTNFSYSGTPNDYYIQIDPPMDFSFGEIVNVSIDAADNSANANIMSTFRYSFTCVDDTIPPIVVSWDPADGDTISQKSTLQFEIIDIGAGVNRSSINFYLDQTNLTPFLNIVPNSSGNGFVAQYTPTTQNYYSLGDHKLRVVAYDQASTPNMADTSITVICIPDHEPPYTQNHFPVKYETEAATNTRDRSGYKH